MALQGLLLTSKGADPLGPCSLGRRESDSEPRGKHCTLFPLPVGHAGHSLLGPTLPPRRHKPLEGCFSFWPAVLPPTAHYWTVKCIRVSPRPAKQLVSGRCRVLWW